MNKNYKLFYEIGNNKYYYLQADGKEFIATESFISRPKMFNLIKVKHLTQGLKLIKFEVPLSILFFEISKMKKEKGQKDVAVDDLKYDLINPEKVTKKIIKAYNDFRDLAIKDMKENIKNQKEEILNSGDIAKQTKELMFKRLDTRLEQFIIEAKNNNPLNKDIFLELDNKTNNIIKEFIKHGCNLLYYEKINSTCNIFYLYEYNKFGIVNIYKITTVRNAVKAIDSYIYDIKLIKKLLKFIENGGK